MDASGFSDFATNQAKCGRKLNCEFRLDSIQLNLNSNSNFQIGWKVQQGGVVVSRREMLKCWNRSGVCAAASRVASNKV